MKKFKAGFVTLIGKPNVGKSTLVNQLVGEKVAITSTRPQTTRNIIQGIVTFDEAQMIFLDTPGIINLTQTKTLIDQHTIEEALKSLEGVDLVSVMVEPTPISEEDKFILENLKKIKKPVFLVINKIDEIKDLPLESLKKEYLNLFPFTRIIPISAKKGTNLSILVGEMIQYLPSHPAYYSSDLITDQPERVLVAELIREKIFILTRQEIPYSVILKVEQFEERKKDLIYIRAIIYVEHNSQKGILIGKSGKMIKDIGKLARKDIEKHLGCQVYLDLWVGVKKNWRKDKKSLKEMGYRL
ncbi:GTPase Era [Candidatus Aerophobetes bacterium]|nr:GTPase Era [Candidatus Aerophobetes bacterium]